MESPPSTSARLTYLPVASLSSVHCRIPDIHKASERGRNSLSARVLFRLGRSVTRPCVGRSEGSDGHFARFACIPDQDGHPTD